MESERHQLKERTPKHFGPFSLHQPRDDRLPAWITVAVAFIAFWAAIDFIAYSFVYGLF